MLEIVLGLALWWAAHLFKRVAPDARARMGNAGRALMSVAILLGLALMILGYRGVETVDLWYPPAFLTHVNNLLMIFAFYLYAASGMKTRITRVIRHPQLTAVKVWAVAHLLVNGDLASVLLFGGILAWAVVSVIVINRSDRDWARPAAAPMAKEVMAVVGTLVVVGVVMMIHNWLGVQPWG
ncbi:MAG: hypothetical protein RIT14_2987 [Pseudomonadota bacterium]